jgi:hypothetical protein
VVPGALWALLFWGLHPFFGLLHRLNQHARAEAWLGWSRFQTAAIMDVINTSSAILEFQLFVLATVTSLAVPLALLVRTVARARLRAGFADPLDRVRSWTAAHATGTRALLALPSLAWVSSLVLFIAHAIRHWGEWSMFGELAGTPIVQAEHSVFNSGMAVFACFGVVASIGIYALAKRGLRGLLVPTWVPEEAGLAEAEDRVHFDAVAVTAETRAAVAAMALLPVLTVLAARGLAQPATEMVLAGYVAVALGGVFAFRRASRIAVGFDGIYVGGSSRAKFFAYASLDGARAKENNLELLRGERVVLRLQLHGKDAADQAAILRRIEEAIARAHEGTSSAAAQVVVGTSERQLARLASGAADYRAPTLTREQLWALVEGPEHDAATRTAAAKALARTGDDEERARLRVAADHHAEPHSRVVLKELATLDDENDAEVTGGLARLVR